MMVLKCYSGLRDDLFALVPLGDLEQTLKLEWDGGLQGVAMEPVRHHSRTGDGSHQTLGYASKQT